MKPGDDCSIEKTVVSFPEGRLIERKRPFMEDACDDMAAMQTMNKAVIFFMYKKRYIAIYANISILIYKNGICPIWSKTCLICGI